MPSSFSSAELQRLADSLLAPTALIELGLVLACLVLAWIVTRVLQGTQSKPASVLFGRRLVDGVLFPVFALLFAFIARGFLPELGVPPAVFKVAIPVLLSLAIIRLTVRVLSAAFPSSRAMRAIERTVSWIAWIAVVLWVTGVLPIVMQELDTISWKLGSSRISLRNVVEGSLSAVTVLVLALWASARRPPTCPCARSRPTSCACCCCSWACCWRCRLQASTSRP
jgi:hypothetical protein